MFLKKVIYRCIRSAVERNIISHASGSFEILSLGFSRFSFFLRLYAVFKNHAFVKVSVQIPTLEWQVASFNLGAMPFGGRLFLFTPLVGCCFSDFSAGRSFYIHSISHYN